MKRIIVSILAVIMVMSFAGCELPAIEDDTIGESTQNTEATTPTDPIPTDRNPGTNDPTGETESTGETEEPAPTVDENHEHSYVKSIVAPTCTEQGYTKYTCVCGDSYKEDYTDPVEHNYQTSVVEPTCTAQGYTLTKCSYCGDASKTDFKEATGHNYQDTVVPATCTEKGYTSHKCSKCNDSYKDTYTNALGHNMVPQDGGEYVYRKDGVYSSSGTKCSACGKTESGETLVRLWSDFDTELIAQYICDYAIQKYGCTRDTSLTLETGGYFPGGYAKGYNEWEVAVNSYGWVDDTFERIMYLDNMSFDEIYGKARCNASVVFNTSGCFTIKFIYG